ncbi:hypothetical protein V6N13_144049 [Hibiscus sabdariffa]|uniref:Late embryogenesis abundant protein LEA-2 subgroup domain-containing protein n=1 Tax=Hibiscus sabdariffa TaxID=183260 RepID=A0ABR2FJF3_9ROSI
MGSPPHSHSSVDRHSRESSWSRFSGSLKPGSRKPLHFVFHVFFDSRGASRPQKPKITMKSIKFEQFKIQAGSDFTEVAIDMITMNSTVKMIYQNTVTFFGVHVTSTPLDLSYSQINIASGTMKNFYQSRKSQMSVIVAVMGNKVPLYGSGASLSSSTGTTSHPVSLKLSFVVRSRAYVLGKLVKPKFYKKIECDITYDPKKPNVPISLKKSCTYD